MQSSHGRLRLSKRAWISSIAFLGKALRMSETSTSSRIGRMATVGCSVNASTTNPFCIKDARRLRDRIFGGGSEVGQFVKIERRRQFSWATSISYGSSWGGQIPQRLNRR